MSTTNNDQGGGQVPTPTPWTCVSSRGLIYTETGRFICAMPHAIRKNGLLNESKETDKITADQRFIVEAVNNHARLESENRALREALAPLANLLEAADISDSDPDDTPLLTGSTPVQVVMGVRKTFVSVGDVRRAAKLLQP
jgi:hypothetical protein